MASQRLFISVPLPEAVRRTLTELMTDLPEVRWTRFDQLHLTLRFLGDVPDEKLTPLTERLAQIRVKPFLLPVEGVNAFPPGGPPRVLWTGVGSGHPRLYQLRQRVDDTLLAVGLNVDLRSFVPHISLARCSETTEKLAARWLRVHATFEGPSFLVDAFELYASELQPDGAVHRLIARFPLSLWTAPSCS